MRKKKGRRICSGNVTIQEREGIEEDYLRERNEEKYKKHGG